MAWARQHNRLSNVQNQYLNPPAHPHGVGKITQRPRAIGSRREPSCRSDNNPTHVNVGDSYSDLGATITGPQADLNLGIKMFLNGTLTSNIVIDTSQVATDTIDYVVTDQSGLTSTSTRTVIVSAPAAPNTPSTSASSTVATSTLTAIIVSAPVKSNTLSASASSTAATSSPSVQ